MQKVLDYLKKNEARFVADLCEYVRFPSVSAQPQHSKDLRNCADWLVKRCRKVGLTTELCPTDGNPVIIANTPRDQTSASRSYLAAKPRYLIYGHYDVQPAEPFQLWKTPPFEPRRQGRSLFARGASDNKGQHLAHLNAVEAYLKTGTDLPCDLAFLIEGEEEVGSANLTTFLSRNRERLKCDGIVISDTGIIGPKHPTLTHALRGICAIEVKLYGPSRDLHSGIFGGTVENPAMALCQLLGQLRDKNGRVKIPGFYDQVVPLSSENRKQLARHPFNETHYKKFLGVPKLFGERGFSPVEQRSARPTLEINGLTSGYQGDGSKTIIPAWASAKLTMRLVPNQTPRQISKLVREYLRKICPPTVRIEIQEGHGGEPYFVAPDGAQAQAGLRALKSAFGCDPVLMREGGSIPIVNDFKKILGVDTLLLGLALPDDNAHSPNEKFDLGIFAKGMKMSAHLWQELGRIAACPKPQQ
ncbi:MAG: dipeptidase [Verrucomicrobia bacterium]|nr:dipeptidase [Verrucomicrobiota bacterium]